MNDADLPAKFVADVDQEKARYESFADFVAIYYTGLIQGGVPDDLAASLITDANRYLWAKLMGSYYLPKDGE